MYQEKYSTESELKNRELDEQIKEIEGTWDGFANQISNKEVDQLEKQHGIKKTYTYGKSWYGTAVVTLLNNGWTITMTEATMCKYLHKKGEGFNFAKAYVNRCYSLTRLMGM